MSHLFKYLVLSFIVNGSLKIHFLKERLNLSNKTNWLKHNHFPWEVSKTEDDSNLWIVFTEA